MVARPMTSSTSSMARSPFSSNSTNGNSSCPSLASQPANSRLSGERLDAPDTILYGFYMDLDQGSTYRDYRCGVRSYERHRGTDIEPYDPNGAPIRVLAAASGVVVGIRDGEDDSPLREGDRSRQGNECGNGVRNDHGNGWATQYCHMRRNSVRVARGNQVRTGDLLGEVAASGDADTPHLHFQVEHGGVPVDPFTRKQAASPPRCNAAGTLAGTLWSSPTRRELATFEPIVIYRAGVATGRPDQARALYDGYPTAVSVSAGALVGYVVLLGAPGGATVDTIITGPNDEVIFGDRAEVPRDFARYLSFSGTRRPGSG